MHILVLGGGIAGVTTAWQLLKDGHEVTLVEAEKEAAEFTSFGNAGLIAPGHAYAWASPRAPGMMLRSLWRNDQAIRFKPGLDPKLWSWTMKFLGQCTQAKAAATTAIKARLCLYSQRMLQEVVAETGVAYDRNTGGCIYFYCSPERFEFADKRADVLRKAGMRIDALDAEALVRLDPGLAEAKSQIAGGLHAVGDESGDCRLFTKALADVCVKKGARILYETRVTDILADSDNVTEVSTDKGPLKADAYVLSLGVYSPHLVRKLGVRLPIYPVKGYSMTVPITDRSAVARLGGMDEDNLLAYCPMGNRMRVTATAEISGYSNSHKPGDFAVMSRRIREIFPRGLDFERASYWAGLRPMTPTAVPIVDRSPYDNLWLNTGHGHMGWTMSNGCARILADLIRQKKPAIDREGMRYEH
jgi:D-amino-acid dehydrogenase